MAIVREALAASVRETARRPVKSALKVVGRLAERAGVRGRELLPGRIGSAPFAPEERMPEVGGPPTPVRVTLIPDSEAALVSLLNLIADARMRIDLMMYGWQDDPTGREVARALADAGARGVRVRLLVDRTGDLIHNPRAATGERTFLDDLADAPNVTLIEPPGAFLRFDHRKLAVIDGRVAWTGGMILTESARRRWHNLAYLAEGPIVSQFASVFEARWVDQGGSFSPRLDPPPDPALPPNATARLIQTDVDGDRSLKATVYDAVDGARRNIFLENPYFSDEILTAKLVSARRRGVDVRVVLTLRGNVRRMNNFETLTANQLVRGGVRVFLYPGMSHVKALSVDGAWCYLGTGNFDELSLRNNRELGLSLAGVDLASDLDRRLFHPDFAASQELLSPLPPPRNRLMLELFALWY